MAYDTLYNGHQGIIFCLESDSIVVSFTSSTGFLRADIRQFGSNISPAESCFHGDLLFLSTTYERELVCMRTQIVT